MRLGLRQSWRSVAHEPHLSGSAWNIDGENAQKRRRGILLSGIDSNDEYGTVCEIVYYIIESG